jgi:hypothetical protein
VPRTSGGQTCSMEQRLVDAITLVTDDENRDAGWE